MGCVFVQSGRIIYWAKCMSSAGRERRPKSNWMCFGWTAGVSPQLYSATAGVPQKEGALWGNPSRRRPFVSSRVPLLFYQHHPAYSMHAWQVGVNTFTWHHHLHLSTKHHSFRPFDNLTISHGLLEDWRIDVRESKFNSETSALKTAHACSRPTRSGRISEQCTAVHSRLQTRL